MLRRFVLALLLLALGTAAHATTIERVRSPGGIEAWLVRENTTPLIAMAFAFRGGGQVQDRDGREGTANLVALMLDEGAGRLDSEAYQQALQDLSLVFNRSPSSDHFVISFRTLTAYRDEAFELLRIALSEPHFEAAALERMRALHTSQLRQQEANPNYAAARAINAAAFPNHPYGRPAIGTQESVAAVTREDLVDFHRRVFARDNLLISVVGDIDAASLGALLDRVFGALPAQNQLRPIPPIRPHGGGARLIVPMNLPQSIIQFTAPGIPYSDEDYMAAQMVAYILGGGNDTTRLWQAVRDRRGLSYGANLFLNNIERSEVVFGVTSTRNETAAAMIETLEEELRLIGEQGPREEELERARAFTIGSYTQRFTHSLSIANALLTNQLTDLGIDWIERREHLIRAVTLPQAQRVARRLFLQDYLFVIAGRPQGITARPARN